CHHVGFRGFPRPWYCNLFFRHSSLLGGHFSPLTLCKSRRPKLRCGFAITIRTNWVLQSVSPILVALQSRSRRSTRLEQRDSHVNYGTLSSTFYLLKRKEIKKATWTILKPGSPRQCWRGSLELILWRIC